MQQLTDPLERRLRAARPPAADTAPDAAEVRAALAAVPRVPPTAGARRRPRARIAVRLAAVAAVAAAAIAAWSGANPPSQEAAASPVRLALRWFSPPAGTILHTRSTLESGGATLVQERWASVDHPERARLRTTQDGVTAESAADGSFDPAAGTVHRPAAPGAALRRAIARKLDAARAAGASEAEIRRLRADIRAAVADDAADDAAAADGAGAPAAADDAGAAADDLVAQLRARLRAGGARVTGGDGAPATIVLGRAGEPRWTLRVSADGRPLELRVAAADGGVERTTWQVYEVLPAAGNEDLLTVRGAHPDAPVVRGGDAERRLYPRG